VPKEGVLAVGVRLKIPKWKNVRKIAGLTGSELMTAWRNERRWYPALGRSLPVRGYDRMLRKLNWLNLPGRKRVTRVRFRGEDKPFYVRLGSSDLQLNQTITFRGEYRPLFENDLGPVRQVVDLGANAGFTIRLWRTRFPDARVIAVEPEESNLQMCRLNADVLGDGDRVKLVRACVDGKPGTVLFDTSGLEQQYHIADPATADASKCVSVDALTVPQILERTGADPVIDLLKCDIQGAEQAVFADCAGWIGRVRNLVVELHDPYTQDMFLADLERAGWKYDKCVVHRTDVLWVLFLFNGRQVPSVTMGQAVTCQPTDAPAETVSASA
jgi:FkbM family methyltransferase